MAVPAPTHTRTPTTVTLTESAPAADVVLDDTGSYAPALNVSGGRVWKLGGVAIPGATGDPQTVKVIKTGTHAFSVTCTNTDGNATSTPSNVTATDAVAVAATANTVNGRIMPGLLPAEYRDPTIATPGIPSADLLYAARTYGSILPAALAAVVV